MKSFMHSFLHSSLVCTFIATSTLLLLLLLPKSRSSTPHSLYIHPSVFLIKLKQDERLVRKEAYSTLVYFNSLSAFSLSGTEYTNNSYIALCIGQPDHRGTVSLIPFLSFFLSFFLPVSAPSLRARPTGRLSFPPCGISSPQKRSSAVQYTSGSGRSPTTYCFRQHVE